MTVMIMIIIDCVEHVERLSELRYYTYCSNTNLQYSCYDHDHCYVYYVCRHYHDHRRPIMAVMIMTIVMFIMCVIIIMITAALL